MRFSAVIVAGGAGLRAGGGEPKQWRTLAGKPVARWSADAFAAAGAVEVVVVAPAGDVRAAEVFAGAPVRLAVGGTERIDSVRAGLEALREPADAVLIHDAARPFVSQAHISALLEALEALETADGALPALPVGDTLKRTANGRVTATAPREGLWRAQTPQAFRLPAIRAAYAAWRDDATPTDDASVLEAAGGRVVLTPGDPALMKVTHPEDFPMAEALAGAARITRVGQGFDAHVFGEGTSMWLCGVEIPADRTLLAHSDGDAGLHALTDALLGAIGCGDIGDHFPPTDPKWKGAASDQFLLHAVELMRAKGGRLVNADITLICEKPKVKPHREAMRTRVAELLELPLDRVSVKATTMEKMGFTGREEGLAASAVVSVETPA